MNEHPGFNPRAQHNSKALSDFVVADLRRASPLIDAALRSGTLKEKKNAEVYTKIANRNVDLVLHTGDKASAISVITSVENKTIMAMESDPPVLLRSRPLQKPPMRPGTRVSSEGSLISTRNASVG